MDNIPPAIGEGLNPTSKKVVVMVHSSHKPLISREFIDLMIEGASGKSSRSYIKNPFASFSRLQLSMFGLAILMLFVGTYMSISAVKYSNISKDQAFNLTSIANGLNKGKAVTKGSSSSPALSTTPITPSELSSYSVAPDMPRYIMIPKLHVDARVLSVGLTSSGALDTPDNIYDTAWYNQSALPGNPGAMLVVGHVSSWTAHGVFYGIKNLSNGDLIQVQRGDGTIYTYKVVRSQVYSSSNVNMKAAITPIVSSSPGLNLITCTGDVIPGTNTFNERIIVFATQVSS